MCRGDDRALGVVEIGGVATKTCSFSCEVLLELSPSQRLVAGPSSCRHLHCVVSMYGALSDAEGQPIMCGHLLASLVH